MHICAGLAVIADGLQSEEVLACLDRESLLHPAEDGSSAGLSLKTYMLLKAIITLIQPDTSELSVDMQEFSSVRSLVADEEGFKKVLQEEAAFKGIEPAAKLLLPLWEWYTEGCGGSDQLRRLFSWAVVAVSVGPLLEASIALGPAYELLRSAIARIDAEDAKKDDGKGKKKAVAEAWREVKKVLQHDVEPWWWLRLVGCSDPEHYYRVHKLDTDPAQPAAAATPAMKPATPAPEDGHAMEGDVAAAEGGAEGGAPAETDGAEGNVSSPQGAASNGDYGFEDSPKATDEKQMPAAAADESFDFENSAAGSPMGADGLPAPADAAAEEGDNADEFEASADATS